MLLPVSIRQIYAQLFLKGNSCIKPKYTIGQKVWVRFDDTVCIAIVCKIDNYDPQYRSFLYDLKELDTGRDLYYFEFRLSPYTELSEGLFLGRD